MFVPYALVFLLLVAFALTIRWPHRDDEADDDA